MSYTNLGPIPDKNNYHPSFMGKVGVCAGKYFPPHRGHLNAIIHASTQVERLYVVVSDNANFTDRKCKEAHLPMMDLKLRAKWLSQELQGFNHIKVLIIDESNIPEYPDGWDEWSKLLIKAVPEKFDVLFGGEPEYKEVNDKYFPDTIYVLFDPKRDRYPISGTEIRMNPLKHWDYILGSARPFFAKKILIAGSESCGKSTITKYLAKIYYTSWSEEIGRYYSRDYLGGNESVWTIEDFEKICQLQYDQDMKALSTANKITFYDTDAVVTQFYCEVYTGKKNPTIEKWIDPSRYDAVFLFTPDVTWVDDGQRFMAEDSLRWRNHDKIKEAYIQHGFKNIIEISGSYSERLDKAMSYVDKMIEG